MRQRVIGWGNPLAGDDGIGPRTADLVSARLGHAAEVLSTSCAPFRLVEQMRGFDRVIIADVRLDTQNAAVRREVIHPSELPTQPGLVRHDGPLLDCLQSFRALEDDALPEEIVLLTAPISPAVAWIDGLSAQAEQTAVRLADAVCRELEVRVCG
jgi:hydrogenase maturation protease